MSNRYAIIDGCIQSFSSFEEVPPFEELPDLTNGWNGDLMLGKRPGSESYLLFETKDVVSESSREEDLDEDVQGTLVEIIHRIH